MTPLRAILEELPAAPGAVTFLYREGETGRGRLPCRADGPGTGARCGRAAPGRTSRLRAHAGGPDGPGGPAPTRAGHRDCGHPRSAAPARSPNARWPASVAGRAVLPGPRRTLRVLTCAPTIDPLASPSVAAWPWPSPSAAWRCCSGSARHRAPDGARGGHGHGRGPEHPSWVAPSRGRRGRGRPLPGATLAASPSASVSRSATASPSPTPTPEPTPGDPDSDGQGLPVPVRRRAGRRDRRG